VVRLFIDDTGTVEEVALLRSSGFARLDRAAAEIGRRYQFKSLLLNGKSTKFSTNLLIKFALRTPEEKVVKPKFEPDPFTTGG